MRDIAIIGSTGSVGTQTLDVIAKHPELFRVSALSAHTNYKLLFEQIRVFKPRLAVLSGMERQDISIPGDLGFCTFLFGKEGLVTSAAEADGSDVLVATVGMVSLRAVLAARGHGKRILLANKETLVAGGQLVMDVCPGDTLIPVDSEHSAIYQCLRGADGNPVSRLLLTASGGPFRTWEKERIMRASVSEALHHPTWHMGGKITVDSASLFNKALEIIEAKWLFHVAPDQIEVLVHPQSIVHSAVEFADGSVIAQMGPTDMRIPILYALTAPDRCDAGVPRIDLAQVGALTFEKPDTDKFPSVRTAYEVMKTGGAAPCVMNAANEEAVFAFLRHEIPFGTIFSAVGNTLDRYASLPGNTLEDIEYADRTAREYTGQYLKKQTGV